MASISSSGVHGRYLRALHYLSAAQIYLQDNVLVREPLRPEHVKPRLLGHWGTCPGINLVQTALNQAISRDDLDALLITGPGHGAAAVLANLYLDGTLGRFDSAMSLGHAGLHRFIKAFCWPGGYPSHLFPGVPGTIHEGGELGYALATAFGAAFDEPGRVVACIVGDGEAETGPTAASWHSTKFLDPASDGAVLPILHLNGYKISNPTVFGTMDRDELTALFTGYGWEPHFATADPEAAEICQAVDDSLSKIRAIQAAARGGAAPGRPRWPMILLDTPKGWTGVEEVDGQPVEGSFRSHQVPVPNVRDDPDHLRKLEAWLRSYRPEELFDDDGRPAADLLSFVPVGDRRLGCNPATFGGHRRRPLDLPAIPDFAIDLTAAERGGPEESPLKRVARYLAGVIARNPHNFRMVCPDELESNKLGGVFEAPTHRHYQWPFAEDGRTEHLGRRGGRVLEVLSEHLCQGWLQGYLLTGRHGLFPCYEAFLPIVTSMMNQFAKFMKMSGEVPWRKPVPSLNYLETSTLWRQEHNGFSHQSPDFINSLLNKKGDIMRVYLPPDANCLLSTLDHCLAGVGHVNLIIANKNPGPCWLPMDEAIAHCRAGASIWKWASTDDGIDPDVVLVGIGDIVTVETLAAAQILRREVPELRVRVVNVTDLLILEKDTAHPHGLGSQLFDSLFTADRPVIVNFHGYPSAVRQLLGDRGGPRFTINGYREEGTTTTPFDMLARNGASRYHLVTQALKAAAAHNPAAAVRAAERVLHYEYVLRDHSRVIRETGEDPPEIREWKWEGGRR
ncbi:phosphoketolase family protein [Haloferula sargassicola]|uniref:Xylulose-5-phosphate phosphoketolase n=1 Tax=Haloferula sargassicola TaxID=490096 RepID=A0ABP9UTF8_9BACT